LAKDRTPVPEEVSADVLFQHDHTCCVCREHGRSVQIHHINEDPTDHDVDNLAVLCLEDHNRTQTRGGFAKHLRAVEVRRYRDERVSSRRKRADEIAAEKMSGTAFSEIVSKVDSWSLDVTDAPHITISRTSEHGEMTTVDMVVEGQNVIDLLQRIWVQLAAKFPKSQFGGDPERFIARHVADLFQFYFAMFDPNLDRLANGTSTPLLVNEKVEDDLKRLISETANSLDEWLISPTDPAAPPNTVEPHQG